MPESVQQQNPLSRSVWDKGITWACTTLTLLGGALFLGAALISVASVVGRSFFTAPVTGDYELVQVMSAMGIAMCLPYCQLKRGHVFVDFFTLWAPQALKKWLDAFAALVLAGVAFLLAWRCYLGMVDMQEYEETSMVLGLPIWWGYVPMVPSFALLGLAALTTLIHDFPNKPTELHA